MDVSLLFQILGSVCVFIGYWLNSKGHSRQHQLFILGHIFLIGFTLSEQKWVLLFLSIFIIYMQYGISKKKYKFKKDVVRVKKIARKIKINKHENQAMPKKGIKVSWYRRQESNIL